MSKNRIVRFDFDPFKETGEDLPEGADKEKVLEAASEFLKESVLSYVGEEKSPVAGYGKFPGLSKNYKKKKTESGRPGVPDLVFSGDMLNALNSEVRGNKIRLEITGSEGAKADGHNNHSGESELPLRRFIPSEDDGETFKASILQGISRIIRSGG